MIAHTNIVDNVSLIEVNEQFANAKEKAADEFGKFTTKYLHYFFFFKFIFCIFLKNVWVILTTSKTQNFLCCQTIVANTFQAKLSISSTIPMLNHIP